MKSNIEKINNHISPSCSDMLIANCNDFSTNGAKIGGGTPLQRSDRWA
jgi:hypothetical protein